MSFWETGSSSGWHHEITFGREQPMQVQPQLSFLEMCEEICLPSVQLAPASACREMTAEAIKKMFGDDIKQNVQLLHVECATLMDFLMPHAKQVRTGQGSPGKSKQKECNSQKQ